MQVEKFTFFGSFYEAMNMLPEEQRNEFLMGLLAYAFEGIEPGFDGALAAMFALAKPNIDSSVKGAQNGSKGGRPNQGKNPSENPPKNPSKNPSENPPKKLSGKTHPKTNKDMDKDKERDRDREMEADGNFPLEENSHSAASSVGADAAGAAPPSDDSKVPVCPLCSEPIRFDAKTFKWRCKTCGEINAPNFVSPGEAA